MRIAIGLGCVAVGLVLAGCAGASGGDGTPTETATVSTPPPSSASPTSSGPAAAPTPQAVAGTYASPGCGARKYAREITLNADGGFTSRDLVSPCPREATCVWSGIVDRKGTFTVDSASWIGLTPSEAGKPAGEPLPARLLFHAPDGTLIEDPDHTNCVYAKAK